MNIELRYLMYMDHSVKSTSTHRRRKKKLQYRELYQDGVMITGPSGKRDVVFVSAWEDIPTVDEDS